MGASGKVIWGRRGLHPACRCLFFSAFVRNIDVRPQTVRSPSRQEVPRVTRMEWELDSKTTIRFLGKVEIDGEFGYFKNKVPATVLVTTLKVLLGFFPFSLR